jgi:hypothetical protein
MRYQTEFSWFRIREFIELRRGYLNQNLPVPVSEWMIY